MHVNINSMVTLATSSSWWHYGVFQKWTMTVKPHCK